MNALKKLTIYEAILYVTVILFTYLFFEWDDPLRITYFLFLILTLAGAVGFRVVVDENDEKYRQ